MIEILKDFDKKNELPNTKEQVNHPSHYTKAGRKECIVEMEEKYGIPATVDFTKHDELLLNEIADMKKRIDEKDRRIAELENENKNLNIRIFQNEIAEEKKNSEKINLNDRIKVKLTPLGVEIYYHQYDELNKKIKENGGTQLEPRMPEINKDGYTEFQLHHFISLYGEHIGMCKQNVIEPLYVELCTDEWKIRYNEERFIKARSNMLDGFKPIDRAKEYGNKTDFVETSEFPNEPTKHFINNCNLTTCRYKENGKCTNEEKRKECV